MEMLGIVVAITPILALVANARRSLRWLLAAWLLTVGIALTVHGLLVLDEVRTATAALGPVGRLVESLDGVEERRQRASIELIFGAGIVGAGIVSLVWAVSPSQSAS